MRALPLLALASLLLAVAAPAAQAQETAGSLRIVVSAPHANATFFVKGTGAGLPKDIPVTAVNGQGDALYVSLAVGVARSLAFNASATPGWNLSSSFCTSGTMGSLGIVAGATTTCTLNLTHGPAPRDPPKPPKPAKPAHDDDHDDDRDDRDRHVGGGPGYWKNAAKHERIATRADGWVANASASSAWLMPAGYSADAEGAAKLLRDATRGCHKLDRMACELLRFEARYLVLRLNLESGADNASASVRLGNKTATYLGLPRDTTVGAIVGAIEAKAGGAAETRGELRMLREASARASAQG